MLGAHTSVTKRTNTRSSVEGWSPFGPMATCRQDFWRQPNIVSHLKEVKYLNLVINNKKIVLIFYVWTKIIFVFWLFFRKSLFPPPLQIGVSSISHIWSLDKHQSIFQRGITMLFEKKEVIHCKTDEYLSTRITISNFSSHNFYFSLISRKQNTEYHFSIFRSKKFDSKKW